MSTLFRKRKINVIRQGITRNNIFSANDLNDGAKRIVKAVKDVAVG